MLKPGQIHAQDPARHAKAAGKLMIIGQGQLLNQLLAMQLLEATGLQWGTAPSLAGLPPVMDDPAGGGPRRLVLWNGHGMTAEQLTGSIERCASLDISKDRLALFNLPRGSGVEQVCLWKGVSGFFYQDDDLEDVAQGVAALLAGKVWLSPRMVTAAPPEPPPVQDSRLPAPWNLLITRREQEVLNLLAEGSTNQEIAETLAISPHTVKTHIYKLFKKIKVSNRLEAVIWYTSQLSTAGL